MNRCARPPRAGSYGRFGWILLGVLFAQATPAAAGLNAGDSVPPFSLERTDGGTFRYPEDARGKVVLLNFWASWCPECKIELPELVRLRETFEGRPFVLLAVNTDRKRKAAERFLKKAGLDLTVLFDEGQTVIKAFSPVGVPASYLLGPTGRVEKVYVGFKKEYIEKYRQDIEALLDAGSGQGTAAGEAAEEGRRP